MDNEKNSAQGYSCYFKLITFMQSSSNKRNSITAGMVPNNLKCQMLSMKQSKNVIGAVTYNFNNSLHYNFNNSINKFVIHEQNVQINFKHYTSLENYTFNSSRNFSIFLIFF